MKEHKNVHLNFFFLLPFPTQYLNIDTSGYRDCTPSPLNGQCIFLFIYNYAQSFVCVLHHTASQYELYVLFLLHQSTISVHMPVFFFLKEELAAEKHTFFHKKVEKCLRSDRLREVVLLKGVEDMIYVRYLT